MVIRVVVERPPGRGTSVHDAAMNSRHARMIACAILTLPGVALLVGGAYSDVLPGQGLYFIGISWTIFAFVGFMVDYVGTWREQRLGRFVCACGFDLRGQIKTGKPNCPECGRNIAADVA